MAGKGGGAWKVAYADFVTAMMAFFMVMWLCSQDQKVKDAVARYFNSPVAFDGLGLSKIPAKGGAIFNPARSGPLESSESVTSGTGRNAHSKPGDASPETRSVSNGIFEEKEFRNSWKRRTREHLLKARSTDAVRLRQEDESLVAKRTLANDLLEDFHRKIPEDNKIFADLIRHSLREVNWDEVAEDLLHQEKQADDEIRRLKLK